MSSMIKVLNNLKYGPQHIYYVVKYLVLLKGQTNGVKEIVTCCGQRLLPCL